MGYGNLYSVVSCYTDLSQAPEPVADLRLLDSGLLSPDGKFYKCEYEEHDRLARALDVNVNGAWELVKRGWVKLSFGTFTRIHDFNFPIYGSFPEVTQAQLDAIFDWVQAAPSRFLPEWYDKVHP